MKYPAMRMTRETMNAVMVKNQVCGPLSRVTLMSVLFHLEGHDIATQSLKFGARLVELPLQLKYQSSV